MTSSEKTCAVLCIYLCVCLAVVRCIPVTPQPGANTPNDPCAAQEISSVQKWSGGIIPYTLSGELNSAAKVMLMAAMQRSENSSCVVFTPRTDQRDYVHFELGNKCCSFIGRVGSGAQQVFVNGACLQGHSVDHTFQRLTGISNSNQIEALQSNLQPLTPSPASLSQEPPAITVNSSKTPPTATGNRNTCSGTCGGCIMLTPQNRSRQVLSSLHYPHNYPANLECVWKLIAPKGYAIKLTFHDFDVEWDQNCEYDFLDIFLLNMHGETVSQKHLCGTDLPGVTTTNENSSNTAVVRFHTDGSYSYKGFLLAYELQVKTNFCSVNNGDCDHVCVAGLNGRRKACKCRQGYSLAQDQRSCLDVDECVVRRGGCHQRCTNTEGSFQCHCKPGYSLNPDQRTCRSCGGVLNTKTGVITSPGYPSPYPSYQNCLWTIHTQPNHHLKITLSTLDITVSSKCKTDFLKLEHGHFPHQRKLCGYYSNITYFINHESTFLRFHTRGTNSLDSSGFRIQYIQVPTNQMSLPHDLEYVTVSGQTVPYRRRLWV